MKTNITQWMASGILSLLLLTHITAQKKTNYVSVADNIVNTALQVQPGEVVVINGSETTITLMHELFVAVHLAGGKAIMELNIPHATKRMMMETPIKYLEKPNPYRLMQSRSVDCYINLNTTTDAQLFNDVPEERFAAVRQASQSLDQANRSAHFRSVSLGQVGGIPTYSYAQSVGADLYDLTDMFWNAVDADYANMSNKAKELATKLNTGARVHVTSPSGTSISFTLDDTGARINCGMTNETVRPSGPASTWLPAGEAYSSVVPTSANGSVVIPKLDFRGTKIKNLKLTFDQGRITNITADENVGILQKALDASSGMKDALSVFDIGLNPHSKPLGDYLSYEMAGVITLGIGNNSWTGGDVESDFSLDFQLKDASVKIGDQAMVNAGHLDF